MVYKFTIPTSLVPAGSTINSAIFSLTTFDYGSGAFATKPASGNIAWYKVTSSWAEASLTSNNRPTVSSTVVVQGPPKQPESGWENWNITALVRDWVNNPATNFGIQGSITNEFQKHGYRSSEFGTADARPKLTITFEPPSAIATARLMAASANLRAVISGDMVRVQGTVASRGEYRVVLCDLRGARVWSTVVRGTDGALDLAIPRASAPAGAVVVVESTSGSKLASLLVTGR